MKFDMCCLVMLYGSVGAVLILWGFMDVIDKFLNFTFKRKGEKNVNAKMG